MIRRLLLLLPVLLFVYACVARGPREVTFYPVENPATLGEWGLFTVAGGRIVPHAGMVPYELATPLFSDYAQKWRTIWLPRGTHASYRPDGAFAFPVGTIITKTFYYPVPGGSAAQTSATVLKPTPATYQTGVGGLDLAHVRLMETRLLVRRAAGWVALPYVWNADGSDATLEKTGAEIPLTLSDGAATTRFVYAVPNQNQCAGCHAQDYRTRALNPIGLKARHLNRTFAGEGGEINQLARLVKLGYLQGMPGAGVPHNAGWTDPHADVAAQARAYLDINCSHCHNATGPARTSGLWLDAKTADARVLGACKPPVAAGRGTGNRGFDIVPGHPEQSIMTYRMHSTDPGEMMPELGRALEHKEGVALVEHYIAQLQGACVRQDGVQG